MNNSWDFLWGKIGTVHDESEPITNVCLKRFDNGKLIQPQIQTKRFSNLPNPIYDFALSQSLSGHLQNGTPMR